MDTHESQWLFRLVEKCGRSPAEKLVAVFDVADSLLRSPEIRATLAREFPGERHCLYAANELHAFLVKLSAAAGMRDPAGTAQQLGILLQGAIAEELRNPSTGALREAARVAEIVMGQSRSRGFFARRGWMPAGSAAAALLVALVLWPAAEKGPAHAAPVKHAAVASRPLAQPAGVSPDEIDAVLELHEKIERGICRAPHLLALPPGQMTAYMNVIEFRHPDDPAADRRNIREFLAWFDKISSTECYTPPMNGHTAVSWKG
jgi:hypothetical protein